ncbi:ATP synthase F1 subunit epsilon [bacterium]|nr:MAG: ATP synthase F1 subunit epsilon [bacterium]
MSNFKTSLLTPDGAIFEGDTVSLNVPGSNGDFQVLHNHAALMSTLDIGIAKIKTTDNKVQEYALSGGFVEVNQNVVTVLAEAAEDASHIDVERAKASKERAEERLRTAATDRVRAEASLKRALNRLKLAGAL